MFPILTLLQYSICDFICLFLYSLLICICSWDLGSQCRSLQVWLGSKFSSVACQLPLCIISVSWNRRWSQALNSYNVMLDAGIHKGEPLIGSPLPSPSLQPVPCVILGCRQNASFCSSYSRTVKGD